MDDSFITIGRRKMDISEIDEIKEMLHFNEFKVFKKQGEVYFDTMLIYNPYDFSGIYEIPSDVNRIIMSYLKIEIRFTLTARVPRSYPFHPFIWELFCYSPINLDIYSCLTNGIIRENNIFDKDWNPAWSPEKMVLTLFMRLKNDLKATISLDWFKNHLKQERMLMRRLAPESEPEIEPDSESEYSEEEHSENTFIDFRDLLNPMVNENRFYNILGRIESDLESYV